MTKDFKAIFRHSNFEEDQPVVGSMQDIISLFRRIDWVSAFHEYPTQETFPELIVTSLANGDALYIQYLGSGDVFQCTTIITIPRPIFGLDVWLSREQWESEAVELRSACVVEALGAFAGKDAGRLQDLWSQARAQASK
jgi:hypothetical protein